MSTISNAAAHFTLICCIITLSSRAKMLRSSTKIVTIDFCTSYKVTKIPWSAYNQYSLSWVSINSTKYSYSSRSDCFKPYNAFRINIPGVSIIIYTNAKLLYKTSKIWSMIPYKNTILAFICSILRF